jgi:hypothetical protein
VLHSGWTDRPYVPSIRLVKYEKDKEIGREKEREKQINKEREREINK